MSQGKSDRFSRALEDGRFLVRPHGSFGAVVNVDEATKDKFLKYRRMAGAPAILIFVITSLMGMAPVPVLAMICAWFTVDVFIRFRQVRSGFKVDRKLWTPLPDMDTGPLFPRWAYLIFVPFLLVMEWASLGSIWRLYTVIHHVPVESWVFVILWTYLLWLCWRDIKKKKPQKRPASTEGEAGL